MDAIKAQLKAIVGALIVAVGGLAITTSADPHGSITNIQFPNTGSEWATFAATVLLSYFGVYVTGNRESVEALHTKLVDAQAREQQSE